MVIAHINMMTNGSTGKIMLSLADAAREKGHEVCTFSVEFFCKGKKPDYKKIKGHQYFGYYWESFLHTAFGRITGINGMLSWLGTAQLIRKLKKISPDIIHIHNIHSYCICVPMLFRYIKKYDIRVVWTLHDCWAVTGRCTHFAAVKCERWRTGCHHCPQQRIGYKSCLESSKFMWRKKKKWFTGVNNMIIVTPSRWLADIVQGSYLSSYPVQVVNNGIDTNIFLPRENSFRERHNLLERYIILGVAFAWGERKGIDVFIELSKRMNEDYQIVLVGTNEMIDEMLPENIISIHRTQDQAELADIYTAADVFVNPTREDTFPTVNIESLACGTPVITFETGGSAEIIDSSCGVSVSCDDFEALRNEIIRVCTERSYTTEDCRKRGTYFSTDNSIRDYLKIYERFH